MITAARWCARIAGLLAFVIGMMLSRFPAAAMFHTHMTLGAIVVLALLLCTLLSAGKMPFSKVAMGLLWAVLTVLVALRQNQLMPGPSHWIVEVFHALLGIGAIGLTEMLGAALTRARR